MATTGKRRAGKADTNRAARSHANTNRAARGHATTNRAAGSHADTNRAAGGGARNTVPLERALSKLRLASRAEARALILAGRVAVNGRVVSDPAARVTPEAIAVAIDGAPCAGATGAVTVALHKPRGYLTTRADPEGRKTVYDLLRDLDAPVVPVGRLDLATSGLLLLTTDTQLANWLTDPASAIPRVYLVTVEGRVDEDALGSLVSGITVDGERLAAAAAALRKASGRESHVVITLTEGRNREVRRLLAAIGHPVTQLRRVQFGGVRLGTLAPGRWRRLSPAELRTAFPGYEPSRRVPRPK